jgi:hypothetical protein
MKKPSTTGPGGAVSPGSAVGPGEAVSPGNTAGPGEEDATRGGSDQAGGDELNATLARAIWQFIAEVSRTGTVSSAV